MATATVANNTAPQMMRGFFNARTRRSLPETTIVGGLAAGKLVVGGGGGIGGGNGGGSGTGTAETAASAEDGFDVGLADRVRGVLSDRSLE